VPGLGIDGQYGHEQRSKAVDRATGALNAVGEEVADELYIVLSDDSSLQLPICVGSKQLDLIERWRGLPAARGQGISHVANRRMHAAAKNDVADAVGANVARGASSEPVSGEKMRSGQRRLSQSSPESQVRQAGIVRFHDEVLLLIAALQQIVLGLPRQFAEQLLAKVTSPGANYVTADAAGQLLNRN
jgi:hypothetical protein